MGKTTLKKIPLLNGRIILLAKQQDAKCDPANNYNRCCPKISYSSPARPDRSFKVCVHVGIQGTTSPNFAVSYHVQRDIVIFPQTFFFCSVYSKSAFSSIF